MNEKLKKLSGWINGPYRAFGMVLLALLLVLFGRDLLESVRVRNDIRRMSNRRVELERRIRDDSLLLENLKDPDFLEKFAREKYLMRKEGEEVYKVAE